MKGAGRELPVMHRTVSGRYVPRTTIWESRPGVDLKQLTKAPGFITQVWPTPRTTRT